MLRELRDRIYERLTHRARVLTLLDPNHPLRRPTIAHRPLTKPSLCLVLVVPLTIACRSGFSPPFLSWRHPDRVYRDE